MHPSSIANMKRCREHLNEYIGKDLIILDVGGRALVADKDRSYRPIWEDVAEKYLIADLVAGVNVDLPMPGPYTLPLEDETIDLVVSGQTLEHVKNPFRSVAEMTRVLKTGSHIILIAPSTGPRHDSIDCWRFMDDSFKAIAEECGLEVVLDYIDTGPWEQRSARWKDHVFIGKKK